MKLVTGDIETTGLNPKNDKVLEIGFVLFDSEVHGNQFNEIDWEELPRLCIRLIHNYKELELSEFILKMNSRYLDVLKNYEDDPSQLKELNCNEFEYLYSDEVFGRILSFLHENDFITEKEFINRKVTTHQNFAGKNFTGFDRKFLDEIFNTNKLKIRHRVLDPAILYLNNIDEECLPDLKQCKERSNLFIDNTVNHTAIEDSIDTLKLILNKVL